MSEPLGVARLGATAEISRTVGDRDTAHAFGNEGVYVLGTPALVGWLEDAALAALAPSLTDGLHSVGTAVTMTHLAPTPLGAEVRIRATITAVEGPRVTFDLTARDSLEEISTATHERFVVETERIDRRIARKREALAT
ncbi:MAG: thioesterase [Actinobacteria bacterium]|nr:thioesterase [Actinomycetota bacterium]